MGPVIECSVIPSNPKVEKNAKKCLPGTGWHTNLPRFRLPNSRIFGKHGRPSISEQKAVWTECENGEGEWGETPKNTTVCQAYIKFVQNFPFVQQREIPLGLILTPAVIKINVTHTS